MRLVCALILSVAVSTTAAESAPNAALPSDHAQRIAAWIDNGAPYQSPLVEKKVAANKDNSAVKEMDRRWWAFQPLQRVEPPKVRDREWARNPVDRFILARLEQEKLQPNPPADRRTLIRRASFDLLGLPPTEKEIQDFLADRSAGAFAKVVERLLASPCFGERWGRHWLDVARYADSTGADEDLRYPYAWRYRDYVIDAFNRDLPYDRFILEQLAGDLLPDARPGEINTNGLVATGFLALGPKYLAEQDKRKMFYDIVDEQIDLIGRGLMGMTLACARCHNHKFDPISTEDYYSLASIFASTKQLRRLEGTVSQLYFAPLAPKHVVERYEAEQKKITAKKEELDEIVDMEARRYAARLSSRLADYMVAARRVYADRASVQELAREQGLDVAVLEKWVLYLKSSSDIRPHLERWFAAPGLEVKDVAQQYQIQFDATAKKWEETLAQWKDRVAIALKEGAAPPEKPKFDARMDWFFAEVFLRANQVRFSFPSVGQGPFVLPEKDAEQFYSEEPKQRLTLLRRQVEELKKTARREPPMACAVAEGEPVQQRVFIRGNVANLGPEVPKAFPRILAQDSQPPITQGSGRLVLAYWLSGPAHPLTARVMVNRIWQWHFGEGLVRTPSNYGRLGEPPTHPELLDYLALRFVESGWSIKAMHRLIMLSSAYQMSSQVTPRKMRVDPFNRLWSHCNRRRLSVEEIRDTILLLDGSLDLTMGGTLQADLPIDIRRFDYDPDKSRRRTVYLPLDRSTLPNYMNLFDFGDATTTGEGRVSTTIAPQALFMMNSKFTGERSRSFAQSLLADQDLDDVGRVEKAFFKTLQRKPTSQEFAAALKYIDGFEKNAPEGEARLTAWQSYCRILMASNEFVYLD